MSGRGSWHAVFAPGLFDAGCLSGLLAVVLSLWNASSVGLLGASTVLAAVGATAACLAWTRRSATFLYPTSVLIAAAVGIAMWATYPDSRMLAVGLSLAALGGAYGCLERQLFSGIGRSYRGPLWHTGLLLAALGPALAVYSIDAPHQWLVATLCAFLFAAALAAQTARSGNPILVRRGLRVGSTHAIAESPPRVPAGRAGSPCMRGARVG